MNIDDTTMVLRVVDKLDKIGIDKVKEELALLNIPEENIDRIIEFIKIDGNNDDKLDSLKKLNINNEVFLEGTDELEQVVKYIRVFGVPEENFMVDLTVARGLDYYTGTVYETLLDDYPGIGSVCSGGRYDDLATHYTKQNLPGVGISIGLTRLFYQLTEGNIIESNKNSSVDVMIIPMEGYMEYGIKLSNSLRDEGIATQVYFDDAKMGKKFNYVDKLNIPYAIVIGAEEIESGLYSFRDMKTGDQKSITLNEVVTCLK